MKNLRLCFYLCFILLIINTACATDSQEDNQRIVNGDSPIVAISNPVSGDVLGVNQEIQILSTSEGDRGISRVELLINGEIVQIDENPEPKPSIPYIVAQNWTPDITGAYTIQIQSYNTANQLGQSKPVEVTIVDLTQMTATVSSTPDINMPTSTSNPTFTSSPHSTDVPTQTSDSSTAQNEPTQTPLSSTQQSEPTPAPLPTVATFAPTNFEAQGRFREIWLSLEDAIQLLGYPTGPEIAERDFAQQYFEHGIMYWWSNPAGSNFVWILETPDGDFDQGPIWKRYIDTWEGDETYSCEQARQNGLVGPVRGFGKIWCEQVGLSTQLGGPLETELGSSGNTPFSRIQFYQGGVILYNPLKSEVFVLFDQGKWQRFPY